MSFQLLTTGVFLALDLVYMIDLKLPLSRWREEYRMSNSSQFQNLALEIEQGVFISFYYLKLFDLKININAGNTISFFFSLKIRRQLAIPQVKELHGFSLRSAPLE